MLTYKYEIEASTSSYSYKVEFFDGETPVGSLELTVEYREKNIVNTGYLQVYPEFRRKGYGRKIYAAFSQLYHKEFEGYVIGRRFYNPIAEKLAKEAIELGLFPKDSWDERYIQRDFKRPN